MDNVDLRQPGSEAASIGHNIRVKPMLKPKPELCEVCEERKSKRYFMANWQCEECITEYNEILADNKALGQSELAIKDVEAITKYDTSHKVRTDLFNAETVSITELRQIIIDDNRIENKNFKLATVIQERIREYQKLIFDKQAELVDLNTKQRASQQYLQELANKLRLEEREKLRLNDSNYKPSKPILGSKTRTKSVTKKFNLQQIKDVVESLKTDFPILDSSTFTMFMKQKGIDDALEAGIAFRKMFTGA